MTFKTWFAAPAALAILAVPAMAQDTAAPAAAAAPAKTNVTTGATVYDTSGNVVGTIESVSGDMTVLATDQAKASVPVSSFGPGEKGPVIAITREQINSQANAAMAEQQQAVEDKKKAQMVSGATVKDPSGGVVGTIKSIDGQFAIVDTDKVQVRLPMTAFAAGDTGPVIGLTKAELDAQAQNAPTGGGASN